MFLVVLSILSRRCPLLATFLSVLFCLLCLLTSDSRFDLVWFRLSCDHGWIRSGSINVRKTTTNKNKQQVEYSGRVKMQLVNGANVSNVGVVLRLFYSVVYVISLKSEVYQQLA